MDSATASLPLMLKQLRLTTIASEHVRLADKAVEQTWSHQRYLAELCHVELLAYVLCFVTDALEFGLAIDGANAIQFLFKFFWTDCFSYPAFGPCLLQVFEQHAWE